MLSERGIGRRRLLLAWAGLVAGAAGLDGVVAHAASPLRDDSTPAGAPIFKPDVPWFLTTPAPAGAGVARPAPVTVAAHGSAPAELPTFVRSRAVWKAAAPAQPYVPQTPKGVSFHHTGAVWNGRPGAEQYLRNIQTFHTGPEREWEDIAYHFLVDLDGNVWEGRPPTVRGNPSIYYDPTGLVLVSYLGDFTSQSLTEAQITGGAETAAWVMRRYGIDPSTPLTGHRDHAPTSCPGDHLYGLLKDGTIPRRVQELLKA